MQYNINRMKNKTITKAVGVYVNLQTMSLEDPSRSQNKAYIHLINYTYNWSSLVLQAFVYNYHVVIAYNGKPKNVVYWNQNTITITQRGQLEQNLKTNQDNLCNCMRCKIGRFYTSKYYITCVHFGFRKLETN